MGIAASASREPTRPGAQYPPPNQGYGQGPGYQTGQHAGYQQHRGAGYPPQHQQQQHQSYGGSRGYDRGSNYPQQTGGDSGNYQTTTSTGYQQRQQQGYQQSPSHQQNYRRNELQRQDTAPPQGSKITREQLERYVYLDRQTRHQDNKADVEKLRVKKDQLSDLEQTLQQLTQHWRQCEQRTAKEKSDVERMQNPTTKSYFQDLTQYHTQLSIEEEEYLEALSEQETAKKQMDGVKQQRDQLKSEVDELGREAHSSLELYREQDEILAQVFNGEYGSELENHLEAEYELLVERKQRISVTRYKWHNARVLVHHACNQLAHACRKWLDLAKAPTQNTQLRYTLATETRNNLVACVSNVQNAQRYLSSIRFPYCTQPELDTLTKAYNNVYTDMCTQDRHKHAYDCYLITHKRASALIQWFDHVINNTIKRDFESVARELDQKYRELKRERERLIRELLEQQGQGELASKLREASFIRRDDVEEDVKDFVEADRVSTASDIVPAGDLVGDSELPPGDRPKPLALSELAPAPTTNDLFGDIEELKRQHERDQQEFERTQQVNRARADAGLEEKLRQRRQRRALQHHT